MTSRLVNKFQSPPLQKGGGYNLDLAVVGGNDVISVSSVGFSMFRKFATYAACNKLSQMLETCNSYTPLFSFFEVAGEFLFRTFLIYCAFALTVTTALASLFGLPWMVASAVPSLNHVRSVIVPAKTTCAR
jgi:hypothetical protein